MTEWVKVDFCHSLWPHGLYSLWNSPGQNTGVGSLSLLQGIFPTHGLKPGLPHCWRIFYQLSYEESPLNIEMPQKFALNSLHFREFSLGDCIHSCGFSFHLSPPCKSPSLLWLHSDLQTGVSTTARCGALEFPVDISYTACPKLSSFIPSCTCWLAGFLQRSTPFSQLPGLRTLVMYIFSLLLLIIDLFSLAIPSFPCH